MPAFMAGWGARRRGRLRPPSWQGPPAGWLTGWLPWSQMSCSTAVRQSGEIQPQAAAHREAAPSDPHFKLYELHHSQCEERSEFSSVSCEVIDPKLVNNHQNYLPPPARPPTARCLHAVPLPANSEERVMKSTFTLMLWHVLCPTRDTDATASSEASQDDLWPLPTWFFYAWNVIPQH